MGGSWVKGVEQKKKKAHGQDSSVVIEGVAEGIGVIDKGYGWRLQLGW